MKVTRQLRQMMGMQQKPLLMAGICLLFSGCTVGPDFRRPDAPAVSGYTREKLAEHTAAADVAGGQAQSFLSGADIPSQWWTLFHSQQLNQMVEDALNNNPDLAAAKAALVQAQENTYAAQGVYYPSLDANASASRKKTTGSQYGNPGGRGTQFNLFNASVDVAYVFDLFGGERRNVEALAAVAESEGYQLEAARLTLTSNVVTAAIEEASLRGQIAATEEIIESEQQQLEMLQKQFELGGISKSDVLAGKTRLAQTRATLPALHKKLALIRNQLTALAGRFPEQESGSAFTLSALQLPQQLPLSLPSELVRQRPDIRAAEAQLHTASAQVGVATAKFFPQISISGSFGSVATTTANLFSPGTGVWSIGTNLLQPILHGGSSIHNRRAAVAAYNKAAAQYQSTVLAAFQNVADVLRSLQSDAEGLQAQTHAVQAASEQLDMARAQFSAGAINNLLLLDAQRSYEQARISLVQAQASRYADTAALFQALGGGWWHHADTTAMTSAAQTDVKP